MFPFRPLRGCDVLGLGFKDLGFCAPVKLPWKSFCDNGHKYPQGGFQGKHEEELVDAEQYFQACINDTGNN